MRPIPRVMSIPQRPAPTARGVAALRLWFVLASCTVLGLPVAAGGEPLLTAPYMWYESGFSARAVAVGDLNLDGHDDAAVADGVSSVGVFLGNGDGTLSSRIPLASGGKAVALVIAELTGDGNPDLAVANEWGHSVSVFAGNGDGTFGPPTDWATARIAVDVAAGDLDGDGLNDLVVAATEYPYFISVLRNLGGGSFAPHVDYPAFCQPGSLCIDDVNGDGRPDVAAASACSPAYISLWAGQGNGTLGERVDFSVPPYPAALRLADMNQDSALDFVVVDSGVMGPPHLLVYPGDGRGNFGGAIVTTIDHDARALVVADFDEDGHLDAALVHSSASPPPPSTVSVLRGLGDGTFAPPVTHTTAPSPWGIAAGRFGPGQPLDLVTAHSDFYVSGIALMPGNGDATFGSRLRFETAEFPLAVAAGDLDRDGHADVAVAANNQLSVTLGDGHASFGPHTDYAAGTFAYSVAIGALDGDAFPDIAVTSLVDNVVSVFRGTGGGAFATRMDHPTGSSPSSVAIGDVNLDGRPDLLCPNGGSGTVSVLLGNGDGSFGTRRDFTVGNFPQRIALGDVNHDQRPDMVIGNFGGSTVSVLLGNGDGTFGTNREFAAGPGAFGVALGDLNGDGTLDIAASDFASNTVSVLTGDGNGTFAGPVSYVTGSAPRDVVAIDLDGDQHLDLAAVNLNSNTVTVLRGNGDGTFQPREDYGAGDQPAGVAVADFNDDGSPDLAVAASRSGGFWVLLGRPAGCRDAAPPSLTVSLTITSLWPPRHELVPIHASVEAQDDCDESPVVSLVSITSDEPDQGTDPDDLPDDIQGMDGGADFDFALRSERLGEGDGRTYTVCYEARDAAGNVTRTCVPVQVPHDQRGRAGLSTADREWSLTIFGTATMPARQVDAGSAVVSIGGTHSIVAGGTPRYGDVDGDGREDMTLVLADRSVTAEAPGGEAVYARWLVLGRGYQAEVRSLSVTDVPEGALRPLEARVWPNPGARRASIEYTLPGSGRVRLRIFDLAGREVATLVQSLQTMGRHRADFSGRPGLYLYRLDWESSSRSGKFTVLE